MLPQWGWTSRKTDKGISILAIAETIAASAISVGAAYWTGTVWHIFLAACFAPFLMLRSAASVEEAAERFDRFLNARRDRSSGNDAVYWFPIFSLFPMLVAASFYFRFSATIRHILVGSQRLPSNYFAALFKQDAALDISLVPGTARVAELVARFTIFGHLGWKHLWWSCVGIVGFIALASLSSWIEQVAGVFVGGALSVLLILLIPILVNALAAYMLVIVAFWLRWSVKSTALIWLPIIYLASRMPRGTEATTLAIQEERPSATAKLIRVMAWLALAFFFWRALIFPSSHDWWQAQDWAAPFLVFVLPLGTPPTELNLWHIASGLNAVLTLSTFFVLWEKYGRTGPTIRPMTDRVQRLYQWYFWLRGSLSIYTAICGLYFAWLATDYLQIAGVNPCLYPAMPGCQ